MTETDAKRLEALDKRIQDLKKTSHPVVPEVHDFADIAEEFRSHDKTKDGASNKS